MPHRNTPRLLPLWAASAIFLAAAACTAQDPDWSKLRARMVEDQIKDRGIKDERVLKAMGKVPRHEFVPEDQRADAYRDGPLPIGKGQTISQPYIVALMTEEARPKAEHKVLEIGTGSGYQAAVLAELVKEVYTIELEPALADLGRDEGKEPGPEPGKGVVVHQSSGEADFDDLPGDELPPREAVKRKLEEDAPAPPEKSAD